MLTSCAAYVESHVYCTQRMQLLARW